MAVEERKGSRPEKTGEPKEERFFLLPHWALVLIGPLLLSLEIIYTRFVLNSGINPLAYTANRNVVIVLILVPFLYAKFKENIRAQGAKILGWAVLLGMARFMADALFFVSQSVTKSTTFVLLSQLNVVFTAIFAYFLVGERLTGREIAAAGAMLAGAAAIILAVPRAQFLGVGLGDLSVVVFCVALSASNALSKKAMDSGMGRGSVFIGSMLFSTAFLGILEPLFFGVAPYETFFSDLPYEMGGALFAVAVLTFVYYYIDRFGASRIGIVLLSNTLITPVLAFLFFGETLTGPQLLGGAGIVAGALLFLREQQKAAKVLNASAGGK